MKHIIFIGIAVVCVLLCLNAYGYVAVGFRVESYIKEGLVASMEFVQHYSDRALSSFVFKVHKGESLMLYLIDYSPTDSKAKPLVEVIHDPKSDDRQIRARREVTYPGMNRIYARKEIVCEVPELTAGEYRLFIDDVESGKIIAE